MIYEMAIADILKLPSVDSDGSCGESDDWSIATALDRTTFGEDGSDERAEYDTIFAEMEYDGYNRVPLHVDLGERMGPVYNTKVPLSLLSTLMMGNGHHRLKMMIMIGFESARVTDDPSESDDTGDPNYTMWVSDDDDYLE